MEHLLFRAVFAIIFRFNLFCMEDFIRKYQDHMVDEKTQKTLNEPLADQTGFNEGHEAFLKLLISKIESGELNLMDAKTLYRKEVYDQLTEDQQEAADLVAVNLVNIIRQIEKLWNLDQRPTFQIQNLVETVFQMKSKFENEYGDVYII